MDFGEKSQHFIALYWKGDYDIVLPTKRFSLPNNMFILNIGRSFSTTSTN